MSDSKKKPTEITYQEGTAILHGQKKHASMFPALPALTLNPFEMLHRIQSIFNTHEGDPKNVGHVVSLPLLLVVFFSLVCLTGITYGVTYFDFGSLNLVIALLVALIKGSLVVMYFMHLRWDRPVIGVVFISALLFTVLFIGLALLDTTAYQPDLIKGYAPGMLGH